MTLKITQLETCVDRFPSTDAVPEALFRLGVAYKAVDHMDKSEETFARLVLDHPDSIWTKQALQRSARASSIRITRADR